MLTRRSLRARVMTVVGGIVAATAVTTAGVASAPVAQAASNDQIAFDFFVSKGLSKVQAAGIVGNFNQESGVPMDPTQSQIGGGPGRGIAQWSAGGGRWDSSTASVTWYAGRYGLSRWSLNTQLQFTWWELTNNSSWGLSQLRAQTTISGATQVFMSYYERCNPRYCDLSNRVSYANNAYRKYANGTPPTDTESTYPTLRSGSSGGAVKTLQYLLRASGRSVSVDGSFGPATNSAVRSFQSSQGLSADGIVGPATWKAITPTLSSGASGEAVKGLQRELVESGYSLSIDGSFGPATLSAVKAYQGAVGLSVDGVVGDLTWGSLVD